MEEIVYWFSQYGHLVTLGLSAVLDLFVLIYAKCKGAAVKKLLSQAKARSTYLVCPHCGKPVQLEDVTFFLPGGFVDDNLNGIPDEKEKGTSL